MEISSSFSRVRMVSFSRVSSSFSRVQLGDNPNPRFVEIVWGKP